ncbi:MAG: Uma2 family endonuclease [Isosphaeraceae bacterium]
MSLVRTRLGEQRVAGVTYDAYVRMRKGPRNRHLRMAYHDGVLELLSPEFRDDRHSRLIYDIVYAYAGAFDVPCQAAGSTTFRKGVPGRLEGKGREADESFYVGDVVAEILGKETLDLSVDPPPSLWVEVDHWGSSKARLPLYAGLGVPEVWRYRVRRHKLWFGRLVGDAYEPIVASQFLPGLTPALVLDLLAEGVKSPAAGWSRWLTNEWFPAHRRELGL